jgi:hypothetical protein
MWFVLGLALARLLVLLAWFGYAAARYPTVTPSVSANMLSLPDSQFSPTELRYRLIERFGEPFYCDPDVYPVAREVPIATVRQRILDLSNANPEMFQAITAHLGIVDSSALTDEQASQVYADSKRLGAITLEPNGDLYHFRIRVPGNGQPDSAISGLIDAWAIVSGVSSEPDRQICPRCLPGDAAIDTPNGSMPIRELRQGMLVWTQDRDGARRSAAIVETVVQPAPRQHEMLHIELSDGRKLEVSPGHPTAHGEPLASLPQGARLDGAQVVIADLAPYHGPATYDILPAGETGTYWANGILLGSTLKDGSSDEWVAAPAGQRGRGAGAAGELGESPGHHGVTEPHG